MTWFDDGDRGFSVRNTSRLVLLAVVILVKVLPFGSVPLKTYLPDGDIDLTAVTHQQVEEEDLARDICTILKGQENNTVFPVKDVQFINAQVKIIKSIVKNMPVDISFNRMAGLGALYFMEQVDHILGKNHLFKRSIILVKAWCYYESRILGAHNGLISTYALEILVVYIINLFHSSLCSPLAVLYKFLEYFSVFNWDSFCLTLNGPVAISSLPDIVAEFQYTEGYGLLLNQEFLRNCAEIYADPAREVEASDSEFPIKFLNIVDPLKPNNNLGRSVSRGNFYRIRCALSYGILKLREILVLPGQSIGQALERYFMNTLDRNGRGQRQDVLAPLPAFGTGRFEISELRENYNGYWSGFPYQWHNNYGLPVNAQLSPPPFPAQILYRNASNLGWLVQCRGSIYSFRDPNFYVPRHLNFHPNAHMLSPAAYVYDQRVVSRGTGTYIPHLVPHSTYRTHNNMHVWMEARNQASSSRPMSQRPPQSNVRIADLPEPARVENGRNFDLSPEDFPLLPVPKQPQSNDSIADLPESATVVNESHCNLSPEDFPLLPVSANPPKVLLEIEQSSQPALESPQVMDSSTTTGDNELATSEVSSLPLALPSSAESDAPTTDMSEPGGSSSTMKMQPLVEETDSTPNL